MDKRKRSEQHAHWITPGVFSGRIQVQEAIGKTTAIHKEEQTERAEEPTTASFPPEAEEQIKSLQLELAEWKKRVQQLEQKFAKERDYLYQLVLLLKREWEEYRNENCNH